LIIIGESVRCRESAVWKHTGPLAGKRVLVTSPSQSTGRICSLLREAGAEPIPCPTVIHNRFDDREGWDRFSKLVDYGGMCLFLGQFDVRCFFEELTAHDQDIRSLGRFKIAAVGKLTEGTLLERGIKADWVLQQLEPQDMADSVSRLMLDSSLPLVWPHGTCESYSLEAALRERCSGIVPLMVRLDSNAKWDPHWKDEMLVDPPSYFVFTGAVEVGGFVDLLGADMCRDLARRSCVAAIDDWTAAALREYGIIPKIRPNASTVEDLINALVGGSQDQVAETLV
jgi:uroporphyrinogen-III synthase